MNQSGVNWLIEQIKNDQNKQALSENEWVKVFEQARQIEEDIQQERYEQGYQNGHSHGYGEGYNDYAEESKRSE